MIWDTRSCRILPMQGQNELKCHAGALFAVSRQSSPVSFHDRTTDRESHTHAAGFGGEEGVEQPVLVLGGDPDTAVLHCYHQLVCFVLMRSDHQFARPIRDRLHRFDAVHHQIDDYLLQLDPIGEDYGQSGCELNPQRHPWLSSSRCTKAMTSLTTSLTSSGACWV